MRKYLLFAAELYSYSILRPLQDAILKRGDQVAWYIHEIPNMLTAQDAPALLTVKEVKQFCSDAIFVPTNSVPDFFPGIKVQIFHGFNVNKRKRDKGHFRIRGYFDLYCTQGPDTTIPFQKLARQYGYFRVAETGWTKLDPMFECAEPNALRKQLKSDKPVIFYASTFSRRHSSSSILKDSIVKMIETNKWQWLVTLHPKTDPETVTLYRNIKHENYTFIEPSEEVIPMLNAADAMLCDTSSILIEFLLLNKPVVTYKTSTPAPHLLNVTQIEQIESNLELALTKPDSLMNEIETYCNRIHPLTDGHASKRVLQAADDFIDSDRSSLRSKPLNIGRRLKMRKELKYYKLY